MQSQLTRDMKQWLATSSIPPTAAKEIDGEQVEVFIVDNIIVADKICTKLKEVAGGSLYPLLPLIGFDTETFINRQRGDISFSFVPPKVIKKAQQQLEAQVPTQELSEKGTLQGIPSMIQIAVSHHLIFIFRCFAMTYDSDTKLFSPYKFPSALAALLKSQHVTKIGVAAVRDSDDLSTYFNVKMNQVLDLDVIAKGLGLPKQSLAALTFMYTGTLLSKKWELLSSRWDGKVEYLSQESIWYAANDALYALKIFQGMVRMPENGVPEVFPDFDSGFKGLSHYYKGKKVEKKDQLKHVRGPFKPKSKKSTVDPSTNKKVKL